MNAEREQNPVRERLDAATALELEKLAEALKLKPLRGGAPLVSRLEAGYFDALDRARPKWAQGPLSYGAGLVSSSVAITPPKKSELLDAVKGFLGAVEVMLTAEPAKDTSPPAMGEQAVAEAEGQLLAQVRALPADVKGPGVDPIRSALKIAGVTAIVALYPPSYFSALSFSKLTTPWDQDELERVVRASVLLASIGERRRLEASILAEA